jgi:hypothetical protein
LEEQTNGLEEETDADVGKEEEKRKPR